MPPAVRIGGNVLKRPCIATRRFTRPLAPTPVPHPALPLALAVGGAATVLIGGQPAVRVTDQTVPCSLPSCVPGGPGYHRAGFGHRADRQVAACLRINDLTAHPAWLCRFPCPPARFCLRAVQPSSLVDEFAVTEAAILGAILGTAVGDALGLPYENLSRRRGVRCWANRTATAWSSVGAWYPTIPNTPAWSRALIASGGDPERFARSLAWRLRGWLLTLPAGIGWATLRAIGKLWVGFSPRNSGVFSAGNGPAMRSALLGAAIDDLAQLRRLVTMNTRITHRDPKAEYGAFAVALAARLGQRQSDLSGTAYLDQLRIHLSEKSAQPFLELVAKAVASAASRHFDAGVRGAARLAAGRHRLRLSNGARGAARLATAAGRFSDGGDGRDPLWRRHGFDGGNRWRHRRGGGRQGGHSGGLVGGAVGMAAHGGLDGTSWRQPVRGAVGRATRATATVVPSWIVGPKPVILEHRSCTRLSPVLPPY